ncbi:MAG: hypothetical protein E3J70_10975 [Candidatus Heimdallarchaeota archaeon]|nr:MAG: hypothetical protein E3J70_10975 [Candidatus Heimdallarchaeota archaeon]
MTDQKNKSKEFTKFEFYFFRDVDLRKDLFVILDPSTIDDLSEDEKVLAEDMLIEALESKIDKRWLFGLEEIESDKAYEFLWKLFNREKNAYDKCRIAFSLVRIDAGAQVLDYLFEVIKSDENEQVKEKALSPLFWNKEIRYEKEELNELYLLILHTAVLDNFEKIRSYAYSILVEYHNMKQFLPLIDITKSILSELRPKKDYQKAIQQFQELVDSKQKFPFSRKIVYQSIKELPNNPPTISLKECEICNQIPDKSYADLADDKSLDNYKSKLETVIVIAYYNDCIMRCPICGRLYDYDYHYEYFVNSQSEEEEELIRTDTKGAIAKIDKFIKQGYEFKKITKCGIFLKIDYK